MAAIVEDLGATEDLAVATAEDLAVTAGLAVATGDLAVMAGSETMRAATSAVIASWAVSATQDMPTVPAMVITAILATGMATVIWYVGAQWIAMVASSFVGSKSAIDGHNRTRHTVARMAILSAAKLPDAGATA